MSTLGSESAFPVPDGSPNVNGDFHPGSPGISTRMFVAAQAMQGMLAAGSRVTGLAASAFAVADDMLVEIDRPGRLERLIDDLKDLKAAVALLQPHLASGEECAQVVAAFGDEGTEYDKACLRVHEVMARLSTI